MSTYLEVQIIVDEPFFGQVVFFVESVDLMVSLGVQSHLVLDREVGVLPPFEHFSLLQNRV